MSLSVDVIPNRNSLPAILLRETMASDLAGASPSQVRFLKSGLILVGTDIAQHIAM